MTEVFLKIDFRDRPEPCRFVNDVLQRREGRQDLFWGEPVKRTHREIVVGTFPDSKLNFEIFKGIEAVRSVKLLVVFAVTALYFSVVSGCVRADEFVADAKMQKLFLKEGEAVGFGIVQPIGKLRTVVRLNAFNGKGEFFHYMPEKEGRGIGTVFGEGFQVTEAAILI